MNADKQDGSRRLQKDDIPRILARAAELDEASPAPGRLAELQAIAAEVGISAPALEQALREHDTAARSLAASVVQGSLTHVPGWVRMGTLGVTDRSTAMAYYWIFFAGMLLAPLLLQPLLRAGRPLAGLVFLLILIVFCGANVWGTARAVRWLDRHGWDLLP